MSSLSRKLILDMVVSTIFCTLLTGLSGLKLIVFILSVPVPCQPNCGEDSLFVRMHFASVNPQYFKLTYAKVIDLIETLDDHR